MLLCLVFRMPYDSPQLQQYRGCIYLDIVGRRQLEGIGDIGESGSFEELCNPSLV